MAFLWAAVLSALAAAQSPWPAVPSRCDVVVAGGSTAAFAAAITAAEASPSLRVCLTEPTDWLGGQLTSSAVSAIDFGSHNKLPANQPASRRGLVPHLDSLNGGKWGSVTYHVG